MGVPVIDLKVTRAAGAALFLIIIFTDAANAATSVLDSATLPDVLSFATSTHPDLESSSAKVRVAEARHERAGLLPNPNFSVEVENFAGSGNNGSFSNSEITAAFSQMIELGGKRKRRSSLANADIQVADMEQARTHVRILRDVSLAFVNLLAAQIQLETDRQIQESADNLYSSVSANVTAGKVPPLEEVKAKVELARAKLQTLKTTNAINYSRDRLAAAIGTDVLPFNHVKADFFVTPSPESLSEIYAGISANPDVAIQNAKVSRNQHALNLAKTKRIPNVEVSGGVRRFEQSDDVAAVALISIPLFIFDSKKTFVTEAEHELTAALAATRSLRLRIRGEIARAHQSAVASYEEYRVMRDDVVPSAKLALSRVSESYRLGKLSLLDFIDSQRTFFESKRQLVQSAAQYHISSIVLESLLGTSRYQLEQRREGE